VCGCTNCMQCLVAVDATKRRDAKHSSPCATEPAPARHRRDNARTRARESPRHGVRASAARRHRRTDAMLLVHAHTIERCQRESCCAAMHGLGDAMQQRRRSVRIFCRCTRGQQTKARVTIMILASLIIARQLHDCRAAFRVLRCGVVANDVRQSNTHLVVPCFPTPFEK
jgi:hypothetical protein